MVPDGVVQGRSNNRLFPATFCEGFDRLATEAMNDVDDLDFEDAAAALLPHGNGRDSGSDGEDDGLVGVSTDPVCPAEPAEPSSTPPSEATVPPIALQLAPVLDTLADADLPFPDSDPDVNVVDFRSGCHRLVYYKDKKAFYGICGQKGHGGRCRKTRVSIGNKKHPAQGRPLAFLLAWCRQCEKTTSSDHHKWVSFPTREERFEARGELLANPEALQLLKYERRRDISNGEDIEPWDEP